MKTQRKNVFFLSKVKSFIQNNTLCICNENLHLTKRAHNKDFNVKMPQTRTGQLKCRTNSICAESLIL